MRPPRLRRLIRAVPAAALVAVVAAGLLPAYAASLGGLNVASLTAFSQPVSIEPPPPPLPLAFDDFSACDGNLDGTQGAAGGTWTVENGRFQCQGQWVRSQRRTAWASATLDVGESTGIVVSAELTSVRNHNNGSGAGLALLSDGTAHLAVVYDRDRQVVEVVEVVNGSPMLLESATAARLDQLVLSATISGGNLSISVDGVPIITGVSIPQPLATNTRHGITADGDNQTRFEWFRVEALP